MKRLIAAILIAQGALAPWGVVSPARASFVGPEAPPPGLPLLRELPALPPAAQLQKLQELAGSDPTARAVAAAVVAPETIGACRAELEAQLGSREVDALAAIAVNLQVQARGDANVLAGLTALTRQIAPDGRLAPPDFSHLFDGGSDDAAAQTELDPVLAWPVHPDAAYKRSVHAITSRRGQILINGKRAASQGRKDKDGVISETFAHPDDPALRVKIYHSPGLMDGYERKTAKIEGLKPLSAAGAAPRLIEHGEAAVAGKGRIYFYVQEFARGVPLKDMPAEKRPLAAVAELFSRLAAAGAQLIVTGSDQDWLLSHILIDEAPGGKPRVSIVGGAARPGRAENLTAHYDMLLSLLHSAPAETAVASAPAPLPAPPPAPAATAEKPSELKKLHDMLQLVKNAETRDQLIAKIPGELYARSEDADIFAVLSLASSDLFEEIPTQAWPGLSRQNAERLMEPRNQSSTAGTIAARWLAAHGGDAPEIFEMSKSMKDPTWFYKKIPAETWSRMGSKDAIKLMRNWLSADKAETADIVYKLWSDARRERVGLPFMTGEQRLEYLNLYSASTERDKMILSIAGESFAKMWSRDIASILTLFSDGTGTLPNVFKSIPGKTWDKLRERDFKRLHQFEVSHDHPNTAKLLLKLWAAQAKKEEAQPPKTRADAGPFIQFIDIVNETLSEQRSQRDLLKTLETLPASVQRNGMIQQISGSQFAKMDGTAIASILALAHADPEVDLDLFYGTLPEEVWTRMEQTDLNRLVARWKENPAAAEIVLHLWMRARE